jgi:serine protease Do
MMTVDRRTLIGMLTAAGLTGPAAALAAEPRMFKSSIALQDGRVLVAVGMNGAGPFIFMIDTGAYVSLIRPELAKQLKLKVTGIEHSVGVGGKGKAFQVYLAKDFIIGGGIRQAEVVLQDSFEFGYQQEIYGALAAGILTATDTDLDFDKGELRIYPDGRGDRPGYSAIDSHIPRVERPGRGSTKIDATVMLNGRPIRCTLDTGSHAPLLLYRGAAQRLGLWRDDRPYAPFRANGIGGMGSVGRIIRAESLEMGGARQEQPLVSLLGDTLGGKFNDFDGILGLSFIRRFNLSIDTRGRQLWVQPSRQTVPAQRYTLSGLWLDHDGDRITVAGVGTGSPAAAAGMRVGDSIIGEWNQALRASTGAPGSVAHFTVERGGVRRDVDLALAPYL